MPPELYNGMTMRDNEFDTQFGVNNIVDDVSFPTSKNYQDIDLGNGFDFQGYNGQGGNGQKNKLGNLLPDFDDGMNGEGQQQMMFNGLDGHGQNNKHPLQMRNVGNDFNVHPNKKFGNGGKGPMPGFASKMGGGMMNKNHMNRTQKMSNFVYF